MKKNKDEIKIDESWKFNKSTAINFDEHVKNSVPGYENFQKNIAKISRHFIRKKSVIYDIGCSTGNTILELIKLNLNIPYKIVGIEKNATMIKIAKLKLNIKAQKKVHFIKGDFLKTKINENADVIIACLLTPFLNHKEKEKFFNNINNILNKNGALILIEKIKCSDVDFESIFTDVYYDFKLKKFSEEEILKKRKSLITAMDLYSMDELDKEIKKYNFKKYEVFFKDLNFVGLIVVK